MQRQTIKPGMKVYYAPGSSYMDRDGREQGEAEIVMVAARCTKERYTRGPMTYAPVEPGDFRFKKAHALIRVERDGRTYEILAGLTTLRGPYAPVAAKVAAHRAQIKALKDARQERDDQRRAATQAQATHLRELLGLPEPGSIYDPGPITAHQTTINIDAETARQIIARLLLAPRH